MLDGYLLSGRWIHIVPSKKFYCCKSPGSVLDIPTSGLRTQEIFPVVPLRFSVDRNPW